MKKYGCTFSYSETFTAIHIDHYRCYHQDESATLMRTCDVVAHVANDAMCLIWQLILFANGVVLVANGHSNFSYMIEQCHGLLYRCGETKIKRSVASVVTYYQSKIYEVFAAHLKKMRICIFLGIGGSLGRNCAHCARTRKILKSM